tara:strand:- start:1818 stop:2993 length:1176 start_codon:yes stop_codon:yes gene_type:complete
MSLSSTKSSKNANPTKQMYISSRSEEGNVMKFTLRGINTSIANGLRRTIIGDIPILGFRGFPHEKNDINIEVNTGRLNNEILKQRISCIPIHSLTAEQPYDELIFILDIKNDTNELIYVKTSDFKIKNVKTDKYLDESIVKKILPPDDITGDYILITRLLPKISDEIPGESLKLTAKLTVNTAGDDGVYNVVSCCAYMNTPDKIKQDDGWQDMLKNLPEEERQPSKISIKKSDWYTHHAKRLFVADSFDFKLETLGVYENNQIMQKACDIIVNKLEIIKDGMSNRDEFNRMLHKQSNSTIENSYDITLFNDNYTVGKILEYILHIIYYKEMGILTYVGFRKTHPHDSHSLIRIAFKEDVKFDDEYRMVSELFSNSCDKAIKIFQAISDEFD